MKIFTLAFFLLAFIAGEINAQSNGSAENYIIVIGAYSVKENAVKFSKQSAQQKLNPKVEQNKLNSFYYVYINEIGNREQALSEVKKLRSSSPYKDAWAFKGTLGELITVEVPKKEPVEVKPEIVIPEPVIEEKIEIKEEPIVIDSAKIKAEMARAREEQIKREVDSKQMHTKKGEMEVLDHIYFYKDAAVLRPESKYQVDKLVEMMKQYPNEKIRIHGHTNGDAPGTIISKSDPNADIFSMDNTVENYGSAKKLSELRANLIRDYLVANGIDKKRMSVKAEGGKKPIYKVDDEKAEANVRVEIEIVKN